MSKHRVVVIDDQTVFREMLVEILRADGRYSVVGSFADGTDGLAACLNTHPDLVILDVMLPGLNGIDVLRRLRLESPNTRVLIITGHERPVIAREAFEAGVHGMVMKGTPLKQLRDAIECVLNQGTYYCPTTAQILRVSTQQPPAAVALSPRERHVVQLVAAGLSTKEIAQKLGIQPKTVSNHRFHIMGKLGVHDVASLTRYAISNGMVEV